MGFSFHFKILFLISKLKKGLSEKEMEGSDGTCECDDTTTLVEIEEAKCAIRNLSFVTVLVPVREVGDKGPGWQVSLSCSRCQEYDSCPKK
jgi:hypothetical protein